MSNSFSPPGPGLRVSEQIRSGGQLRLLLPLLLPGRPLQRIEHPLLQGDPVHGRGALKTAAGLWVAPNGEEPAGRLGNKTPGKSKVFENIHFFFFVGKERI